MNSPTHRMVMNFWRWVLVATALSSAGCYDWISVKPTELPKLNGGFSMPIAHTETTTVVAVSVADVEQPDGRVTQIQGGGFDIRLLYKTGKESLFKHPIVTQVEGDSLVVGSSSQPKTQIPLADISEAKVSQLNQNKTFLAFAGVGLVALGVVLVAVAH
jgi:hypothetical protein